MENMSWYKLKGAPWENLGKNQRIQKFFDEQYTLRKQPKNATLLIAKDDESADERDWIFFTPEGAALCRSLLTIEGGYPCPAPTLTNLRCLAGDLTYLDDALPDSMEGFA
jgi:hypothetical protein